MAPAETGASDDIEAATKQVERALSARAGIAPRRGASLLGAEAGP